MTTPVEAWFEKAYIKGATHKLQSQGFLLKGTHREPDRVTAKEVVWRVAGRGEAREMAETVEAAQPMNAGRETVTGTLKDYQAADWIRHPDINKMSENEQQVVQQTAAWALGRKFDRINLDEYDTGVPATAEYEIGDGTGDLTLMDFMQGEAEIMGQGGAGLELFCPVPSLWMKQLMLYEQFSSSDYNGPDYPLAKMTVRRKWGFCTYFQAPNEMFTFDTGVSATAYKTAVWAQTYMWAKSCAGFATNYEMQARITWENRFTSYFANNWMPGAAKVILPEGFRRLKFKFNAALIDPHAPV
jgi:hypothetical protein